MLVDYLITVISDIFLLTDSTSYALAGYLIHCLLDFDTQMAVIKFCLQHFKKSKILTILLNTVVYSKQRL